MLIKQTIFMNYLNIATLVRKYIKDDYILRYINFFFYLFCQFFFKYRQRLIVYALP